MRYYPISLDINQRNVLVVGGGEVGTRKVKSLLACGAHVTVISLVASPPLQTAAQEGRITLKIREYRRQDLENVFLVIGATDNEALNRRISTDARQLGKLCNIADRPEVCNFILPAIIHRGDLVITVSTSGKSPAFAKKLRRDLETRFGEEYAPFLELMGAIRQRLLAEAHAPEAHKPLFERLIAAGLPEMIRRREIDRINDVLQQTIGSEYTWSRLMPTPLDREGSTA